MLPDKIKYKITSHIILGKEIKHVSHFNEGFTNPDETTFNVIKRLLELEKHARDE